MTHNELTEGTRYFNDPHHMPLVVPADGIVTRDEAQHKAAVKRFNETCLAAKIDKVVRMVDHLVDGQRIPSVSTAGPSTGQMARSWADEYAAKQAKICAEAEAAYAARNPHEKGAAK